MKLSTRGRYGIHAMYELAKGFGGAPMSIKAIAEKQDIPEAYLEQIIAVLRRDELVTSIRGAQGGYILARPASEISAGDILRAAEGSIAPVECCESGCDRSDGCVTFGLYKKIQDAVDKVVDSTSLADMLSKFKIARKECAETESWLKLLYNTKTIDEETFKTYRNLCGRIQRMLTSSCITIEKKIDNK